MLADFTQLSFNGWVLKNTALDTFLMPTTRRSKPNQVSEAWTKIDVVMYKGKSLLARSREKQLGSLVDIQSFVHAEGSTRGKTVTVTVGILRRRSRGECAGVCSLLLLTVWCCQRNC